MCPQAVKRAEDLHLITIQTGEVTFTQLNERDPSLPDQIPKAEVVHLLPHCLALGHWSPLDAICCPYSPSMKLLFSIFTFWGVCNIVRADSVLA